MVPIAEGALYGSVLRQILTESGVTGAKVHDARVVAVCREHGINTIWSADRDFARFPGIDIVNPLVP